MYKVIASLEALGLANTEAQVYIAVLQNPNVNGSQLTKQMSIPKPSVYLALDKLYHKGLINLIPGKSKQYSAQDINVAFEKLRTEFNLNINHAVEHLQELQPQKKLDDFFHIDGYENYIAQFKNMIHSANQEIYIHTNNDLNALQHELTQAQKKGVRIIIYSFGQANSYNFPAEIFYDKDKPTHNNGIRTLIVIDNQKSLIATGLDDRLLSIYTENELQVNLVAENIHNAIYWLKLYQQYPNFDYPCRLETLAEQNIHISGYSI